MENSMFRSGLALGGANTWLTAGNPPEEVEDYLLTAEGVTGLDLLATELVVLSACETGLGQVHVGEGVFGLRRAFVLAETKTMVIGLRKVQDEQTQYFLVDLYQHLEADDGRAEAFRQEQLAIKGEVPRTGLDAFSRCCPGPDTEAAGFFHTPRRPPSRRSPRCWSTWPSWRGPGRRYAEPSPASESPAAVGPGVLRDQPGSRAVPQRSPSSLCSGS